jgi:uncharacterized membrane protein YphA (DoxX/SURF4 family)
LESPLVPPSADSVVDLTFQAPTAAEPYLLPADDSEVVDPPEFAPPTFEQPDFAPPAFDQPEVDPPLAEDQPGPAFPSDYSFPEGTIDLTADSPYLPAALPDYETDSPSAPLGLYRGGGAIPNPTQVAEVDQGDMQADNSSYITQYDPTLDEHRAARARALGEVDPGADVVAAPQQFLPPSTYGGWPSFTLFVLRVGVAAILGIRATQALLDFTASKQIWANSILTRPDIFAIVEICLEFLAALMLLLGFGSRVAGGLIIINQITVLIFLTWGNFSPFHDGVRGFMGEFQILMILIGLLFLGVGGGRAGVDAAIYGSVLEKKNARLTNPYG